VDFFLTPDQQQLREAARSFARRELPQVAIQLETRNSPPSRDLVRKYAELGYLGINIPTEYGGLGLGNLEALIVLEELARVSSAVAFPVFESCVGPVRAIERFASKDLKHRVVPAVCAGEITVAVSMSEPDAGSALTDLKTRGVVHGDRVVLNGVKRWCSGGGHADGYVVYCRLSDEPGAKGIGAVYVERETDGLTFGPNENLMGFRGIPSSDLIFQDAEIPVDNIVVPAGGFKHLMEAFDGLHDTQTDRIDADVVARHSRTALIVAYLRSGRRERVRHRDCDARLHRFHAVVEIVGVGELR
jgi:butyryl-CoA dehydrogenase